MFKTKKFGGLFLSMTILFTIMSVVGVDSSAIKNNADVVYEDATDFEEDFSEPDYDKNKYGYLTYEVIDNEVIITDCDESVTGKIVVPETIEGYPVTTIGERAFEACWQISEVVLPDSIKEIGAEAFSQCYRLESINIPESVTTLRELVFGSCYSLTEVVVPDNITKVELGVFSNCMRLEKVILPDSLKEISDAMFNACFNLKEVVIPDTITEIGELAFFQCYSLESVVIPESVEKLGACAFGDIPNLKDIFIYNPDIILTDDSPEFYFVADGIYNVTSVPEGYTVEEYVDFCFELIQTELNYMDNGFVDSEEYRELKEKYGEVFSREFYDVRTDLTIHGYDESTAHDFADEKGINFVAFESEEENPDNSQQGNVEDNSCSRCGEVHNNTISELFCVIKSIFNKLIEFFSNLF